MKTHLPKNKQNPTLLKKFPAMYTKTLIAMSILFWLVPSCTLAQSLLIDNFEDRDLVADNYCYWTAYAYAQGINGEVLNLENADDGTGNRAAHVRIRAGTGTWRVAELLLKLAWDEGSAAYKTYVDYGYDLRAFQQIRFRAKASPGGYCRFQIVSNVVPNYQYYYKSLNLSGGWTQFSIPFSELVSDQNQVPLNESLRHTDELKLSMYPSEGAEVEIWIDDVELVPDSNYISPGPVNIPSGLKEAAELKGLEIGFTPTPWHMTDEPLLASINNNAHFIMTCWETGQAAIQQFPNYWDFAMADSTLKWARDHSKKVKVQHLVWHGSTPDWIINAGYTPAEVNNIMRNFIRQSISYYKTKYPGVVTHYSVVNEAIDDATNSYRHTFWYNMLGPDYIANAFRFAHEADPNAKLYYNDYGIDGVNPKSNAVYAMVSAMRNQGVPIHGIGLQMHIFSLNWFPGKQSILDNMNRFGQLGLDVYITESDIVINDDLTGLTNSKFTAQAAAYRQIVEACVESPYCNDFACWGISDKYSWLVNLLGHDDWPLLLDENFQPKSAWCAIMEELAGAGDLNADCQVNLLDLSILASQWLNTGDCSSNIDCADLNSDSKVNFQDFARMGQNF
jgi:endo-1,4-beta-xylanase